MGRRRGKKGFKKSSVGKRVYRFENPSISTRKMSEAIRAAKNPPKEPEPVEEESPPISIGINPNCYRPK